MNGVKGEQSGAARSSLSRRDLYRLKRRRHPLSLPLRAFLQGCTTTSTAIWYIDAGGVARASLRPI